jgi:hypothetical protein
VSKQAITLLHCKMVYFIRLGKTNLHQWGNSMTSNRLSQWPYITNNKLFWYEWPPSCFFVCSNLSGYCCSLVRKVCKKTYICRTHAESFLTSCLKCNRAAFVLHSFLYPLSIYLINYGLLAFTVSSQRCSQYWYSVQIVHSFAIQLKLKALGACFLKSGIYFLC